ncbi:hypothetical protein STTU_0765 [Streptomyces sp. Tu6071]|uniref:hypothetical protein n=1 Tax=Streptomyces sp. Tu6071 TaxID=355249 RepID=UPI00020E53EE|nr:hypothetical protein [Streptomyces sp. Tu6071]EGJ73554.1 hypothetical protein STTU_0765 [Streptomyces sp. Tu6071]
MDVPNYPPPPNPGELVMAHWKRIERSHPLAPGNWTAFTKAVDEAIREVITLYAAAAFVGIPLDVPAQVMACVNAGESPPPLAELLQAWATELSLNAPENAPGGP